MTIPEAAYNWAVKIANDQSHGYSQANRWGTPDYDCSSFVLSAYKHAGVDVGGATYTGNMKSELLKHGFSDVTSKVNLNTGTGLQPGDILLYHLNGTNGHTAMYVGNGKIVHARGQSYGSAAPGDQGSEIAVTPYSRSKWATVLRYTAKDKIYTGNDPTANKPQIRRYNVTTAMPIIRYGDTGSAVKVWQIIMGLITDGEFGRDTLAATLQFQRASDLEDDGEVGSYTWAAGLKTLT